VADPAKPWLWQQVGEGTLNLVDSDYYYLAFVNLVKGFKDGDPKQPVEIPSAVTRERIALVPLMEELLRDYLTLSAATFGHADGHEGCEVCLHCANAKILKRIDRAKAAT
jgi:hypothetical protein